MTILVLITAGNGPAGVFLYWITLVYIKHFVLKIGHVKKYPTMHHFGIPIDTQSMTAYMILTE